MLNVNVESLNKTSVIWELHNNIQEHTLFIFFTRLESLLLGLCFSGSVSDVIPGVGPKQLGSSPAAASKANTQATIRAGKTEC